MIMNDDVKTDAKKLDRYNFTIDIKYTQLSEKINWTYELSKVYGWIPGQKLPQDNQNPLQTKRFKDGLSKN